MKFELLCRRSLCKTLCSFKPQRFSIERLRNIGQFGQLFDFLNIPLNKKKPQVEAVVIWMTPIVGLVEVRNQLGNAVKLSAIRF
jgi:hypothetical protein